MKGKRGKREKEKKGKRGKRKKVEGKKQRREDDGKDLKGAIDERKVGRKEGMTR
jgi:hypothetical protein